MDRATRQEVWLFGHHLPTAGHQVSDPLNFAGQDLDGDVTWTDNAGRLRAVSRTTADGVYKTRWLDGDGQPEVHWRGGCDVMRMLLTGGTR